MPRKAKSRNKGKSSNGKSSSKTELAKKAAATVEYTLDDVLQKVQDSLDCYDYDMAQKFCQAALEMDSDNVRVLELTGQVMMDIGDMEAAKQCYGRCTELEPDKGYLKYLYLGQMMCGEESLQCYRKAIDIITSTLDITTDTSESQENEPLVDGAAANVKPTTSPPTSKDVSSAYLAIAELYMTDLCDDGDAEEQCIGSINKAIEYDKSNPEGYQVLADYHLIKGEIQKAKEQINKSISLWLPKAKSLVDDEEDAGAESKLKVSDPLECLPITAEAQLKAAKTLIEVEEYNDATDVLELLLDQDDSVADVWYLLGWSNYLQGEDFKVTAKFYLTRCHEVAEKAKYDDADVMEHLEELLDSLKDVNDEVEEEEQEMDEG